MVKAVRLGRLVLALLLLAPTAAAQGGNGELKVWVESTTTSLAVPIDGGSVEAPLTFRAVLANTTCVQSIKFRVTLLVLQTPPTPVWANYSFASDKNVTFEWEAGDYRYLDNGAEVQTSDQRTFKLQWPRAPPNSTHVYQVNVGEPVTMDAPILVPVPENPISPTCYFSPQLKPQLPLRIGAYLEGGAPPPLVATVAPVLPSGNGTLGTEATFLAADEGGDAPGPGLVWVPLALATALAWSRRRR